MKEFLREVAARQATTVGKGRHYEHLAREFLRRQGLTDFRCNVRSRYGEIDLVARDGDVMVFIEVRYRTRAGHGSPAATVTPAKQKKIITTARYFLQKHGLTNKVACRFDVVGISGSGSQLAYRWIRNAF